MRQWVSLMRNPLTTLLVEQLPFEKSLALKKNRPANSRFIRLLRATLVRALLIYVSRVLLRRQGVVPRLMSPGTCGPSLSYGG